MKPDGVPTTQADPTETVVEPVAGVETNEDQPQEEQTSSPPQLKNPENVQDGANAKTAMTKTEANGKKSEPKNKTKAQGMTRPGTTSTKVTNKMGAVSRPPTTHNRMANGVMKTAVNIAAKKPLPVSSESKKTAPVGASAQPKKGPTATAAAPRTQVKVAEQRPAAATRSAVNNTTRPATAPSTLNKKPATSNSAPVKVKVTAPRPTTTAAAKWSVSSTAKASSISKTTRPTTAPTSRSTTSSAPVRSVTMATKPAALRTNVSAPPAVQSSSSKVSSTAVAAKKDLKTTNSPAARKPFSSSTMPHTTAVKTSKPETSKSSTAAKRLHAERPKADETRQVPTRKVPPSPRNTPTRTASSRMVAASNNQQQGGRTPVASKMQRTKPTQSVSPLVITEKPSKEPTSEPVELSEALETNPYVATAEAIAHAEAIPEVQAVKPEAEPVQHQSPEVQADEVAHVPASDVEIASTMEQPDVEQLATPLGDEASTLATSSLPTISVAVESKNVDEYISMVVQVGPVISPETVTASPTVVPNAGKVLSKGSEVAEKPEQITHNVEDEEEEEKECSQQVSVSDMSGTQPTEESRPGSAGLAGSVWRPGGLPSELDSEDVSCSQQGASELSAPGVLEGTESMDDLGEASLKGADGEGVSAGSPDFEKVPDIPANEEEDDDDDDRVCDMEVGSEMAEDSHRQCHDNEEDEDVEMASEGVTESGLESYGNLDEDDFVEDYRLDNLNRMQPSSTGLTATPWNQANHSLDPCVESQQLYSTFLASSSSYQQQTDSELATQATGTEWQKVGNAKEGPSSPGIPTLLKPLPSSSHPTPLSDADQGASLIPGLTPHLKGMSPASTIPGSKQVNHSCSDASTPEEQNDYKTSPEVGNQQPILVSPVAVALPDITENLVDSLKHDKEEELQTLPAEYKVDDVATVATSVMFSPSLAIDSAARDTDGEMCISRPNEEPGFTGDECIDGAQVHDLSKLEECEEVCAESEEVGSDTPQSATSAASSGFECITTSKSNAQSTTESCTKSPGIFSLENEEPFTDDTKDPAPINELTLVPACAPADVDLHDLGKQGEDQVNTELCGENSKDLSESCALEGTVPTETGFDSSSSSQHQEDWIPDAPHSYYSTICKKTDSSVAGKVRATKQHPRPRVDHVTHLPCLSTALPHGSQSIGCNAQLRRLEQHQQQLQAIEQWREQKSQTTINDEKGGEEKKLVAMELEKQRRDLLELQIQEQQEELKQRQQIMQWQKELEEQQQQQSKHQNRPNKTITTALMSPSGLGTIYEALEASDSEEYYGDQWDGVVMVKETVEHTISNKMCLSTESIPRPPKDDTAPPHLESKAPFPEVIQDQMFLTNSALPESPPASSSSPHESSQQELDWGKKADIVQQLINQTLLLASDNCSPILLLPGGATGTLSPLETSLWPSLPSLTPTSATVTSVSSFSAEVSGTTPQGEWTVVELETYH